MVHLETAMGSKLLLTDITGVELHARVCAQMGRKGALDCECPETVCTLVGLLVGVDASVSHQVTRLLELLRADGTPVPHLTSILPQQIFNIYSAFKLHAYHMVMIIYN